MTKIGVNVTSPALAYDSSSLQFADLMLSASPWSFWSGAPTPAPKMDPNGYPLFINDPTKGMTSIVALNAVLPAGKYIVTGEGVGQILINAGGADVFGPGHGWWWPVDFDGTDTIKTLTLTRPMDMGQWTVVLSKSQEGNYLRNIKIMLPGNVGRLYNYDFITSLQPFDNLRFMDWGATNGSPMINWADRNQKSCYTIAGRAMYDYEYSFKLCNSAKKGCWLCIPHQATDDYIRQYALLADKSLSPDLPIYIEYSNECWNFGFAQYHWLVDQGAKVGMGGWQYIGRKQGQAINLFKETLSPNRKCVRVLASQAAYFATGQTYVKQCQDDNLGFDALAIAPYFDTTANIGNMATLYKTNPASAVSQVLNGSHAHIQEVLSWVKNYSEFAKSLNTQLLYYECGQTYNAWQNEAATPLLLAANGDPRMKFLYKEYIDGTNALGNVALADFYSDCGTWSKWGCWGHKPNTYKTCAKWQTLVAAARAANGT